MNMPKNNKLDTNWQISMTVDDILRGQGAVPDIIRRRKPVILQAAERAYSDGSSLLHPIAVTTELLVREHRHERIFLDGGNILANPLVTRHLTGAQRVAAAICSIGPELEETVTHLLGEDPLYALALDGLGNAAVEILAQQVCRRIAERVEAEELQASTPLSPGSQDWPVEIGQPQIFSLLDPSLAGIHLTPAGMMLPKKSMSFIVGLGTEMSQANMCLVCSMKETCRYQHA